MRTRTPPAARNRLDTPAIYTTCIAPNCHRVGIHDQLCYTHLAQSRRRLAAEHRRLQHTHGALVHVARVIRDLLRTNIDLTQPAAGGRWKLDLARALQTLDRLIDPPA